MIYNRIPIAFGGLSRITGPTISYQYDAKQVLVFEDLELPPYYEADFCNEGDNSTITIVGTAEGVEVPDNLLQTGKNLKVYIVVTGTDEDAVETRYEITHPVRKRPARADIQPTPAEQLQIDALLEAMNEAVETAQGAAQYAEDAEAWAVGQRDGQDVPSTDPTYENNAKYYSELASEAASISGWVRFYIDENGDLHYVKTANCDLDFYIDASGNLHVTSGVTV